MFKFTKRIKEEEKKNKPISVVIDTDIKQEIIQKFDKGALSMDELFVVTQDAKKFLNYDELSFEQKYLIEAYQDYILYIARPLRAYEVEEGK